MSTLGPRERQVVAALIAGVGGTRWPGCAAATLDNSIVNVALPSIQRDLDLGLAGTAWDVNGYILSFAVLLLTGGRLADSSGRRRVFLVGLAGFTGASLLAGLAPSAGMLIAARVLQGFSVALMTPPTLAIYQTLPTPRKASRVGRRSRSVRGTSGSR